MGFNLSDSNGIRTLNHLVRKWTLNRLAKLTIYSARSWTQNMTSYLMFQFLLEFEPFRNSIPVKKFLKQLNSIDWNI